MDLLNAYQSDEEDEDNEEGNASSAQHDPPTVVVEARPADRRFLQAAPAVSLTAGRSSTALTIQAQQQNQPRPEATNNGQLMVHNNPKKDVLYQPAQGPVLDLVTKSRQQRSARPQIQSDVAMDATDFDEQRIAYARTGVALNPTGDAVVQRTTVGYTAARLEAFAQEEADQIQRPINSSSAAIVHGSDDEAEYGIWAPPSVEERYAQRQGMTAKELGEMTVEQQTELQRNQRYHARKRKHDPNYEGGTTPGTDEAGTIPDSNNQKMGHLLPDETEQDQQHTRGPLEATSTFHGAAELDYKGRSWMAAPAGLGAIRADGGASDHQCYIPKQCVHRFTGQHDKGVHRIRLFPITGHLLLSAGLDGTCKVWSVAEKQLMRTYAGHKAAVRDVQFNRDGTKFLSASFDRYLRLWDTESGRVLKTFTNGKMPYCVQFYPRNNNFFVVGCSDKKIVAYSTKTGKVTQEYNHHLGAVNAILFVEDGGIKMVTSSDDKKILIWEWDIGVPIKYISDPSMQSMPALVMHPTERFFCGQSLDNTIVVFQSGNKFTMQRKKKFSGHVVSGYACEMAFSPDGKFLVSGDGNGNLFFWDWKKHKILQKYRAHSKGPAIGCVWHPIEPSLMFTCGWDGVIKMWQ